MSAGFRCPGGHSTSEHWTAARRPGRAHRRPMASRQPAATCCHAGPTWPGRGDRQHRDVTVFDERLSGARQIAALSAARAYSLSSSGPRTFRTFLVPRAGLTVRRMYPCWLPSVDTSHSATATYCPRRSCPSVSPRWRRTRASGLRMLYLGAGERIRTADLPFTRSPFCSYMCSNCTDAASYCSDGTRCAGVFRGVVPRFVPTPQSSN